MASFGFSTAAVAALPALPSLPLTGTINQINTATGINSALQSGTAPVGGFAILPTLPVAALGGALNQIAGSVGADLGAVSAEAGTPLLNTLMQRVSIGGTVLGEATPGTASPQLPQGVSPWASAIGGHSNISGNSVSGAQSLSAGVAGLSVGLETQLADESIVGASLALSHESSSAGSGGAAHSNDVTLAVYGRHALFTQGYVAGALAYGWHDVTTNRIVSISGTDDLVGKFTGQDLSGRIEAGYRLFLADQIVLAPFLAFGGDSFSVPTYHENAASGTSTFALDYSSATITNDHTEAGVHLVRSLPMGDEVLSLGADVAWAHQLNGPPIVQVAFGALSGSNFLVRGLRPAIDTALLGAGMQMQGTGGFSYGVRADSQFGSGMTSLSGTASLVYRW